MVSLPPLSNGSRSTDFVSRPVGLRVVTSLLPVVASACSVVAAMAYRGSAVPLRLPKKFPPSPSHPASPRPPPHPSFPAPPLRTSSLTPPQHVSFAVLPLLA